MNFKRIFSFILMICLVLSISFSAVAANDNLDVDFGEFDDEEVMKGDYNDSGSVTASDAIYLLYYVLYGEKEYPLNGIADLNGDGIIDSDDAIYLLYNALYGSDEYPFADYDEERVAIRFNTYGEVSSYELVVGDELPVLGNMIDGSFNRHAFLGWYDSTLTTQYTKVPDKAMTLYALYDGYNAYTFDGASYYDPNNKKLVEVVDDPFGGSGKVLHTQVINKNDTIDYGYLRGLAPSVYEGINNQGFEFKKGHTYEVSFKYRFPEDTPGTVGAKISAYSVAPKGIYVSGNKTSLGVKYIGCTDELKTGKTWNECRFTVTNTTNYKHLFLRLLGGSTTSLNDLYIDDLVIADITPDDSIKLVVNGVTESTDLKAGDTLPTLDAIYNDRVERSFEFVGWFDETLTTQYTKVDSSVKTYYAKYDSYTAFTFETNGIYDPNNKYSASKKFGVNDWWRGVDPTGADNVALKVDLTDNGNNIHVALSEIEGALNGYKLSTDKKYLMMFDYYVDTTDDIVPTFSVRCAAQKNIGSGGGKTDSLAGFSLHGFNKWLSSSFLIKPAEEENADFDATPYLILLAQREKPTAKDMRVYIDNVQILEFGKDEEVTIKTIANDITFNDNGDVSVWDQSYIGERLPLPEYYGAEFIGWYDETGIVPHTSVNINGASYTAKHDGAILNFENGGIYDPNGKIASNYGSRLVVTTDPTNSDNSVLRVNLNGGAGNYNIGLNESGYSNEGYKLTVGYQYEISLKYYMKNANSSGVSLQFRGCLGDNIGISGGKSSAYGNKTLKENNVWTGITVKFTYTGSGLESAESPYLVMMLQDRAYPSGATACTATVFIDDVVIKEIAPQKTYIKKSVKIGDKTLGDATLQHNIVIPDYNFSYLARMQCEELAEVISNITTTGCAVNIVYEKDWVAAENQINIFVGNVSGHERSNGHAIDTSLFTDDDFAYAYSNGDIYVNAKSTYALAMGVSELAKALDEANDGAVLSGNISGKYSEKIGSYSTETYYRPAMLEDFDGEEIDTARWQVFDGVEIASVTEGKKSKRSAAHTYLEDGNLVIAAAFDDKYYYGGMLKSHGKMDYLYGYLEISCITPHGAGIWTAMWATPNGTNTGLFRSEIDINESFGNARYTAFNMHSWLTTAGGNLGLKKYSLDNRNCPKKKADAGVGKTFNDEFHTFGYYWTQDGGKFTVDGRVQFELNYKDNEKYYHDDMDAFNERLCLIVSMTVGNPGHSAQFNLDESADYWYTSNKFIVDYVHIYQVDGQLLNYYPPKE